MNKLLTAIALAFALPAAANAADPAPEPKQGCCEKMKAEGKDCCCKGMDHKDDAKHAGHGDHGEHGTPKR